MGPPSVLRTTITVGVMAVSVACPALAAPTTNAVSVGGWPTLLAGTANSGGSAGMQTDAGSTYDPVLAAMIGKLDETRIHQATWDLQNFTTRVYPSPGNTAAATYLYDRLDAIPGLTVTYQGGDYRNVIATLPGTQPAPGTAIIVGAHYDSASIDPAHAPGATDNSCGDAIVLELARVMSQYRFRQTIVFAFWNKEEGGLAGSDAYAAAAAADGMTIPLYFNYDSSCYDPGNSNVLDVMYNDGSKAFADRVTALTATYGIGLSLTYNAHGCTGDHVSFWEKGYPAITTHSPTHAPQAHSPADTVELVNAAYAKKNAQVGMLLLAGTAGPVSGVIALPGATGVPHDLDADGRYEDVNGNGTRDFDDVVLYFGEMAWVIQNEPVAAFDFNGNTGIDFDDVVWLYQTL